LGLCSAENPGFWIPFDSIFAKACAYCGGVAERDCDAWSFFDVAFFCFVSHRDCFRASGVIGGIGSISFCLFLQHLLFTILFICGMVTFSSVFSVCFWGRRSSCLTDVLLSSHCALSHPVPSVLVGSATTPPLYIDSVFLKKFGERASILSRIRCRVFSGVRLMHLRLRYIPTPFLLRLYEELFDVHMLPMIRYSS
jgi:hypothetical protein